MAPWAADAGAGDVEREGGRGGGGGGRDGGGGGEPRAAAGGNLGKTPATNGIPLARDAERACEGGCRRRCPRRQTLR